MPEQNSLVARMAEQRHIDPANFYRTIKSTLMPSGTSDEQVAAFLLVADRYGLDPITREIFAFPARKGGGIMPVLSIDGWVKLVNSHPKSAGFEFEFEYGEHDKLFSCTCTMHRSDRVRPVKITEFYAECYRNTDAWNLMPARMLRHKAFKEAARYCFGFSGLTDEDEATDMVERATRAIGTINGELTDAADPLDQWAAEDENQDSETSSADNPTTDEADDAAPGSDTAPDQSSASSAAGEASPTQSSPAAPSAADKRDMVDRLLQYAGDPDGGEAEAKLEWLTNLTPAYEDRFGKEFTAAVIGTVVKVVNGQLPAAAAKKYLMAL